MLLSQPKEVRKGFLEEGTKSSVAAVQGAK